MIRELLTPDRIVIVKSVESWHEAISLAAQPLVDDGSITPLYVDKILHNVERYGPYIVLADRLALPHACGEGCVNRLAMSLLQVRETVDLAGKQVNVFLVLAAPDNNSHITALSHITELLYDNDKLALLATGSREQVLELIATF